VRSALYRGTVAHHRLTPIEHHFSYKVALPLLFLDEIDEVCAMHPLWSNERANVIAFHNPDFLGAGDRPLAEVVRAVVEDRTGVRPSGPIALLAHLRTWGWLFNPIALFYCFDPTGEHVEWLLAEVTNTPWHERHPYLVGPPGTHHIQKELHVSPFLGMDQRYALTYTAPGERCSVGIANEEAGRRVFGARLDLERYEMTHRALGGMVASYPLMTLRVSLAIYHQAFSLWRAGAPFLSHPPVAAQEDTAAREVR